MLSMKVCVCVCVCVRACVRACVLACVRVCYDWNGIVYTVSIRCIVSHSKLRISVISDIKTKF